MTTQLHDPQDGHDSLSVASPTPSAGQPFAGREVVAEIRCFNDQNKAHEDLWIRVGQADSQVRRASAEAQAAEADWLNADLNCKAIQAEYPERSAPRPRQLIIATGMLLLDAVACYFAAEALGSSPIETLAFTGLFLALLAVGEFMLDAYKDTNPRLWRRTALLLGLFIGLLGLLRFWFIATVEVSEGLVGAVAGAGLLTLATLGFVVLGYLALRAAETSQAWLARRKTRICAKLAATAQRRLIQQKTQRDRLAAAYVSLIRRQLIKTCSADQLQRQERAVWIHLTGSELS